MRSEKGFLLILFLVLSACASNNNSTPTPSGSQNNAVASSSKRNVETIKSASGETCVIDEKRVCEEGTPGVMNDPYSIAGKDIRERVAAGDETGGEEFSGATLRYTLALLQGDREVILVCERSTSTHFQIRSIGYWRDPHRYRYREAARRGLLLPIALREASYAENPRRIANGNTWSWGTTRRNIWLIRVTLVITICLFAAETRSENKPASLPAPSQGNSLAVDKTESALLDELRTLEAQNPNSIEVTRDLDLLSWYYWTRGRFSLAEPLLIKSLAIKEKTLTGDDPEIQEDVDRLGYIYFWEGRFAEAEQLFDRALQNPSEADYTNPWLAGLAHNGLGWIYVDEGRQQEAESMLDQGLEIRRRSSCSG